MTVSNSGLESHLSNDTLVRSMDDELSGGETIQVEVHLAGCESCRGRLTELRRVSDGFELLLNALQLPPFAQDERIHLQAKMESARQTDQVRTGKVLARFGWFMAAAAMLALGLSYAPLSRIFHQGGQSGFAGSSGKSIGSARSASLISQAGSPFEIDGETFQYLPYSNPDLPIGGSHVVQMEVPISSLAEAGVLVESTANRMTMPDRAVLADVLLGMDGQPIGVHVLASDL